MSEMERQKEKKKSKKWRTVGGIVLVLLLVVAAFYAGMWTVGRASGMRQVADPDAFQALLVSLEETPDEAPEMAGAVKSVMDNSIFVTTINTAGVFSVGPGASTSEEPPVEVLVGYDTVILADVTALEFLNNITGGNPTDAAQSDAFAESTKRVIKEGVLEDIEPNTMIWIWGEHTGDRINATTVLYLVSPFSM